MEETNKSLEELQAELIYLKKKNVQKEIDELKKPSRSKLPSESRDNVNERGGGGQDFVRTANFLSREVRKKTGKKMDLGGKKYEQILEDLCSGTYQDLQTL